MHETPHESTNRHREHTRNADRPDASRGWRAEYRAQAAPIPDGGRYFLPDRGGRVEDRDAEDDAELVVVDIHPGTAASEYPIETLGGTTVAEVNPDYDDAAPVVEAVYIDEVRHDRDEWTVDGLVEDAHNGAIGVYSFPADRLLMVEKGREAAVSDGGGRS